MSRGFIIYPKFPRAPQLGKGWAEHLVERDRECRLAHEKRFTDAELAAEFHRQDHTFDLIREGYGTETFGLNYAVGHSHEEQAAQQRNTLRRFALAPHYYESEIEAAA
ncbi:MAG: hypothetical protein ABS888_00170 [Eubacteriales bacterium]